MRGEREVYSREMSQFYKTYTGTTCLCVRTLLRLCVHVGVCLKLYFYIGALACVIPQPYFSSVYNFFQSAMLKMPNFNKVKKTVIKTDNRKKEKGLVRKISLFVSLTMQV